MVVRTRADMMLQNNKAELVEQTFDYKLGQGGVMTLEVEKEVCDRMDLDLGFIPVARSHQTDFRLTMRYRGAEEFRLVPGGTILARMHVSVPGPMITCYQRMGDFYVRVELDDGMYKYRGERPEKVLTNVPHPGPVVWLANLSDEALPYYQIRLETFGDGRWTIFDDVTGDVVDGDDESDLDGMGTRVQHGQWGCMSPHCGRTLTPLVAPALPHAWLQIRPESDLMADITDSEDDESPSVPPAPVASLAPTAMDSVGNTPSSSPGHYASSYESGDEEYDPYETRRDLDIIRSALSRLEGLFDEWDVCEPGSSSHSLRDEDIPSPALVTRSASWPDTPRPSPSASPIAGRRRGGSEDITPEMDF